MTEITAALDELSQAYALVQSAKSEVTTRVTTQDNAIAKVDQVLTKLAGYVESVAGKPNGYLSGQLWQVLGHCAMHELYILQQTILLASAQ